MRRIIFLLCLLGTFMACKPGIPEDIIQPDQMRDILVDIHYVDGYLMTQFNADTTKILAAKYYNGVYKKFKIDSTAYANSMDYYYKNPKQLNKIYKEVDGILQKKVDALTKKNAVSK